MAPRATQQERSQRLYALSRILRDGAVHKAASLAARLEVSERTIYRDIARLEASGLPVQGTPGTGYQTTAALTLPPLNLSVEELEALHLGLAVVADVADPDLRAASRALAARLDAALPEAGRLPETGWSFDVFPFAEGSNAFHLIPALRAATRSRVKVQAVTAEASEARVIWPLSLEFWGRLWTCVAWDETANGFAEIRVDQITRMTVLPDGFPARAGRRYEDWLDLQRHLADGAVSEG